MPWYLAALAVAAAFAHLLFWVWRSGLLARPHDRLVDGAGQAWRWFSVQAMALALALQGAWAALPDDLKAQAPPRLPAALTVALLLLGLAGRLVRQR